MIWSTHLFTVPNAPDRVAHKKKSVPSRSNSKLCGIGLKAILGNRVIIFCEYSCDGLNHNDYFCLQRVVYFYMVTPLLFISQT